MSVSLSSTVETGSNHLQLLLLHQLYKPYISGMYCQGYNVQQIQYIALQMITAEKSLKLFVIKINVGKKLDFF